DKVRDAVVERRVSGGPLTLGGGGARHGQVTVGQPDAGGRRGVAVCPRPGSGGQDGQDDRRDTTRACRVGPPGEIVGPAPFAAQWPAGGAQPVPVESLYPRLADRGLDCGPLFQGVQSGSRSG
ncbi:hypothetical protein VM98_34475, partial [Streptomyces rubellomurinus subsp. indigoferus]